MLRRTVISLVALLLTTGCAYSIVKPVKPGDSDRGFRYYDPLPLLLEGCTKTEVFYVPNLNRGYAVQPRAWWAKNTYELHIADGQLTQTKGTIDATSFLTFFQNVATEAIKNAAALKALSVEDSVATASRRRARVYSFIFDENGNLEKMKELLVLGECPVPSPERTKATPATKGGKKK